TVHVGDFSISAASSDVNFNTGASTTDALTLTSTQNFAGTVNVAGSMSGLTVTCTSASLTANGTATSTCTISSSTPGIYSLTVTANITSSSTTLTCTSSSTGSFTVVVTGTAATGFGTGSHSANAPFTFGAAPGFSLSATGSSFNSGATGSTIITVTSLHGFSGTVSFTGSSSPAGVT